MVFQSAAVVNASIYVSGKWCSSESLVAAKATCEKLGEIAAAPGMLPSAIRAANFALRATPPPAVFYASRLGNTYVLLLSVHTVSCALHCIFTQNIHQAQDYCNKFQVNKYFMGFSSKILL